MRADPDSAHLDDVLHQLATALLRDVDSLTEELVETMLVAESAYTREPQVPREDIWRSCHDNLSRVLQALTLEPTDDSAFDAPRATGMRRAQQGVPLESVLHAFRLGWKIIWKRLADQARTEDAYRVEVLLDAATSVWQVVDRYSSEVADS